MISADFPSTDVLLTSRRRLLCRSFLWLKRRCRCQGKSVGNRVISTVNDCEISLEFERRVMCALN